MEVRALDPSKPRRVTITHAGRTPILNPARPLRPWLELSDHQISPRFRQWSGRDKEACNAHRDGRIIAVTGAPSERRCSGLGGPKPILEVCICSVRSCYRLVKLANLLNWWLSSRRRGAGRSRTVLCNGIWRTTEQVLADLSMPPADVLRLQISAPDATLGTLPLEEGIRLIQGARSMLLAAACTPVRPPHFTPGKPIRKRSNFSSHVSLARPSGGASI